MPTLILLIEDNPGDAVIFREKLNASDLDYKLATAKRLAEGLDRLAETDFDIILVDLSLPDAQGLEAVTKVRKVAPHRPLIVLTGLDDATAAAEAKKQGAVDYLVKWYVDSVSLARYIRYAIAQYQMFERGEAEGGDGRAQVSEGRPRRPPAPSRKVVEGERVKIAGERRDEALEEVAESPTSPEQPGARSAEAPPTPANGATPSDGVREALSAAEAPILIVEGEGRVVVKSQAARAWVPSESYPWPLEEGARRVAARDGQSLEQHVARTVWQGADAWLVTLRSAPEPAGPSFEADAEMLRQTSEAALSYVELAVRRSQWMADVLRSSLDLHRVLAGEVETRAGDVDLLEIAQQVTREQRGLAMSYGLPLRTVATRKKAMAFADRNLVTALLNRLIVDAVHAAGPDGVKVTVEVEKHYSSVSVSWSKGRQAEDAALASCLELGNGLVSRIAALCDGECRLDEQAGGQRTVTVRVPCRSSE